MSHIYLFSEVKATGVFSGFDAIVNETVLTITKGHARLNGDLIPGGWSIDLKDNAPGWWSVIVGPETAAITQDLATPGLPLWLLYIEQDGHVAIGRDLRRRCIGAIWEANKPCGATLPLDEPLAFRRLQAATGEVDGNGTPYYTECVVTANLHYGQVIQPGTVLELEAARTTGGKIGLVIEGYDAGIRYCPGA